RPGRRLDERRLERMPVQHRDGRPHPAIRLAAMALAVLTVVAPLGGVALAQSLGDPAVAERAQEDGTAGRSGSQEAASQTEGAAQDRAPRDEAGAEGASPEADASPVQDPASSHEAPTSPSSEATPQPWFPLRFRMDQAGQKLQLPLGVPRLGGGASGPPGPCGSGGGTLRRAGRRGGRRPQPGPP